MKFDRSNKFDLCYYGQVNSLRLKKSVASKWASKHLWGVITLLAVVHRHMNECFKQIHGLQNFNKEFKSKPPTLLN